MKIKQGRESMKIKQLIELCEAMNVSDWQHKENQNQMEKLEAEGFKFEVSDNKYVVYYKDKFVGGAGSLPRTTKKHWKHAKADVRDMLNSAIITANNYKVKEKLK